MDDTSFEQWFHPEVASILMKQFRRHMLGLYIAIRDKNKKEIPQIIYTGFVLYYKKILFWVSAGHVINYVIDILNNLKEDKYVFRWADDYQLEGAESIPANIKPEDILSTYKETDDPDFGLIRISNINTYNLLKNPNLIPLDDNIWYKYDQATPTGYYIFGFPEDLQRPLPDKKHNETITHTLYYSCCCIPVEKIEYEDKRVNKSIFQNSDDFYGEIKLPLGGDGPESIIGMSGSPIFSIERNKDNLIYRFYGVLKSWDKNKTIRGEHISRILKIIGS